MANCARYRDLTIRARPRGDLEVDELTPAIKDRGATPGAAPPLGRDQPQGFGLTWNKALETGAWCRRRGQDRARHRTDPQMIQLFHRPQLARRAGAVNRPSRCNSRQCVWSGHHAGMIRLIVNATTWGAGRCGIAHLAAFQHGIVSSASLLPRPASARRPRVRAAGCRSGPSQSFARRPLAGVIAV